MTTLQGVTGANNTISCLALDLPVLMTYELDLTTSHLWLAILLAFLHLRAVPVTSVECQ